MVVLINNFPQVLVDSSGRFDSAGPLEGWAVVRH